MKKYIVLPMMVLTAITLFLASCTESAKTANKENEARIPVKLTSVMAIDTILPINASGMVASDSEAYLSFKTGGVISQIYVDEGQSITKGQLLASLDLTEIDAQVTQAKNGMEKAQRDLDRVKHLYADSAATLEQLQNATTAYDVAKQSYTIAQFNQQFSVIKAPVTGKVVRKLKNTGEVIGAGMPVFYVNGSGKNDWVVRMGVSDKDWARLQLGDKAQVTMDAYPDVTFTGKVSNIAEAADPQNGLYQIEVKIEPQGHNLSMGLFAKVSIQSSHKTSLFAVPIEAIAEGNGKEAYVFLASADGQSASKQSVKIAFLDNTKAYVLQGLEPGQQVITAGSPYLTDKAPIEIEK
jgi:RND family efflux transporter MFP subunit